MRIPVEPPQPIHLRGHRSPVECRRLIAGAVDTSRPGWYVVYLYGYFTQAHRNELQEWAHDTPGVYALEELTDDGVTGFQFEYTPGPTNSGWRFGVDAAGRDGVFLTNEPTGDVIGSDPTEVFIPKSQGDGAAYREPADDEARAWVF